MNRKIERALISVSNKEGLVPFVQFLHQQGIKIISTGNTAKFLSENGITVQSISDFTGFPEILEGRVKTLHPKIHGGLLGKRSDPAHLAQMKEHDIEAIDLVIVNLYPFEQTVSQPCTLSEAIEKIDIGGPSMIRSAAKNFESVGVIVDPADYDSVAEKIRQNNGALDLETRWKLAQKVFSHTASYDGAISNYLSRFDNIPQEGILKPGKFSKTLNLQLHQVSSLRYGENPHQLAASYQIRGENSLSLFDAKVLHGKELSFNNLLDLDAALKVVLEFNDPACVIIKHNNPCGVAIGGTILEAFQSAKGADPVSAFGGIVAVNRPIDSQFASVFQETFFEAVLAPSFEQSALETLQSKKNLRILELDFSKKSDKNYFDLKKINGGFLVQDSDTLLEDPSSWKTVTKRNPTEEEKIALSFVWKVAKHVKSNAIVYAKKDRTVGIGAGQMSRVDSAKIGALKANESLAGSVLASDAFFPFRDGVDEAAKQGVTAIIQPGGSVRDEEVIAAANEHGIAMIFTGVRHFKH